MKSTNYYIISLNAGNLKVVARAHNTFISPGVNRKLTKEQLQVHKKSTSLVFITEEH